MTGPSSPRCRRRQGFTSRPQDVAVELFRLRERLRVRPNVAWVGRILRDEYGLRFDDHTLRGMLEPFVRVARDRRRLRRLSPAEALIQILEFCDLIGAVPSDRWLGRFMRQSAFGFAIADEAVRKLRSSYRARPPSLRILHREFRARPPQLGSAIGKGSPLLVYGRNLVYKPAREALIYAQADDPGELNASRALQMLLALEPRLKA